MSDQSPDSPPRPQYGEYATPEEQRARIRQPAPSTQPSAPAPAPPAPVWGATSPTPSRWPEPAPGTRERRTRPVDRIVTFALLAYGLVNVVSSLPALIDYTAYTDTVFKLLGVNATLSDPAAGKPWGFAAALVLAVGWLITAGLAWLSLRRGRLTWWIPLVGGFVFTFAAGTLMLVPLMSDPAVWNALVGSIR